MIYYARPFTYNPDEARAKYKKESAYLYEIFNELIVSTIPLTEYVPENLKMDKLNLIEREIFILAEQMIRKSSLLVNNGTSKGVSFEIDIARLYNVPVLEYDNIFVKSMILRQSIETLGNFFTNNQAFGLRAYRLLKNLGAKDLKDIIMMSRKFLLSQDGIGKFTVSEIEDMVKSHGYKLSMYNRFGYDVVNKGEL